MPLNVALSASGTNAPATVTLAADPLCRHVLDSVSFSYSATPTSGRLSITDGGATVYDLDLVAAGPWQCPFPAGLESSMLGNALVITLAAGGLGVTGKVNVDWHDENT